MTTTGTVVCALGQNCQKEGGHMCLMLSEVEKPHLACKGKYQTGIKTTTQTFTWCPLNYKLSKERLGAVVYWC